jgi:hypothetical protein
MNIDSNEIQHVALAQAPRFDMYGGIHKALRALMSDTLLAVGRMDAEDAMETAEVTERVLTLLDVCAGHLQHENDFIHSAVEARAPGASSKIAGDHVDHLHHIGELSKLVANMREAAGAERYLQQARLYAQLALFVADNYQHMHVEETAINAILWASYTDAELVQIHDALVASIPPEEMMLLARWLVPFNMPLARAAMLCDVRSKVPPPAFEAILATVRPHLTSREWEKLEMALA